MSECIRKRLDSERTGIIHAVKIGDQKVYIRTGEYSNGDLGEIFLILDKEGGELRVYEMLAIAISIGLQHGVPLGAYTEKLQGQSYLPAGITNNREIPIAKSIADYLARWLNIRYGGKKKNEKSGVV